MENIFEIRDLSIAYKMKKFDLKAVTGVDLDIKAGKVTALVGESGSGKSTLASGIINCISQPGEITGGSIYYFGRGGKEDIAALSGKELEKYRWREVSMVFQGAQSALDPLMTVYEHFEETYAIHNPKLPKKELQARCREKTEELIRFVSMDPERVMNMYPHELSGGMKQRVMIAFSMLLDPKLIILDEPTTALDVIVQGHIFKILKEANRTRGISMLLLTHDIGVVAEFSDYVAVMYGGRIMEYGSTREVFRERRHPYTAGLINATPSLFSDIAAMHSIPGSPPDIRSLPAGCVFHPRCERCTEKCRTEEPEAAAFGGHTVRCHYAKEAGHGSDS